MTIIYTGKAKDMTPEAIAQGWNQGDPGEELIDTIKRLVNRAYQAGYQAGLQVAKGQAQEDTEIAENMRDHWKHQNAGSVDWRG